MVFFLKLSTLLYELTNVNVLCFLWSAYGIAQDQNILEKVAVHYFLFYNSYGFITKQMLKKNIDTLPLHDSQTLSLHPPFKM